MSVAMANSASVLYSTNCGCLKIGLELHTRCACSRCFPSDCYASFFY